MRRGANSAAWCACALTPARARAAEDGTLDISFERPVRAPAPGQAAALYAGDMLIAGGIIAGN